MDEVKFEIKTVKETSPERFDERVNTLIADGFWLSKSRVLTLGGEVVFIAFLDKKTKLKEKNSEEYLKEKQPMDETPTDSATEIAHL